MEMLQALQDPYLLHSFTRLSHVPSEELDPKGPKEEDALENPDHTSTAEKSSVRMTPEVKESRPEGIF